MGIFLNIDTSKIRRLNEFEDENGNNDTDEVEDVVTSDKTSKATDKAYH